MRREGEHACIACNDPYHARLVTNTDQTRRVLWRSVELALIALSYERDGSIGGRARDAMLQELAGNETTNILLKAFLADHGGPR